MHGPSTYNFTNLSFSFSIMSAVIRRLSFSSKVKELEDKTDNINKKNKSLQLERTWYDLIVKRSDSDDRNVDVLCMLHKEIAALAEKFAGELNCVFLGLSWHGKTSLLNLIATACQEVQENYRRDIGWVVAQDGKSTTREISKYRLSLFHGQRCDIWDVPGFASAERAILGPLFFKAAQGCVHSRINVLVNRAKVLSKTPIFKPNAIVFCYKSTWPIDEDFAFSLRCVVHGARSLNTTVLVVMTHVNKMDRSELDEKVALLNRLIDQDTESTLGEPNSKILLVENYDEKYDSMERDYSKDVGGLRVLAQCFRLGKPNQLMKFTPVIYDADKIQTEVREIFLSDYISKSNATGTTPRSTKSFSKREQME